MKRSLKFAFYFGILVFALVGGLTAVIVPRLYPETIVTRSLCSSNGTDQNLISQSIDIFRKLKISGAFLISQRGQILAEGYCGTSDPTINAPISAETKFNIGSLTKQFTGFVLLELVKEGRIRLNDLVVRYIPELEGHDVGRVTIEQLMRMTSGIPYILPMQNFLGLQLSRRIRSQEEMVEAIAKLNLEFNPGAKFSYSNLGYSLLGVVISKVDGSPWAESLRKRIFVPFGMAHTSTEGTTPEPPENLAAGLLPLEITSKTFFVKLPHWNYSMIKGAGGIVSTVRDLHLWNEGLSKKVKEDPLWAKSYFPTGKPSEENYSYGWFYSTNKLSDTKEVDTVNHGGEDPGYCATNIRLQAEDSHIVMTTNSDYCALKEGAYKSFTRYILSYLMPN